MPARIAAALGISEPTLYKYYGEILRLALTQTIAQVVAALYQNGLEGDAEAADFFLINVEGYKKPDIVVEHVLDWLDGEMVRAYPGNSRRPREASRPNPSIPKIRVPHSWLNKKGELASKLRRRKGQGRA